MENVAEKVRKLLALAGGASDHEAKAAMLKARELMARYKLSDKDVQKQGPEEELKQVVYTKQTCSGLKNYWFVELSRVIAENHCCASVGRGYANSSTCNPVFIGLGDDPEMAHEVFDYAVHFIQEESKKNRRFLNSCVRDQQRRNALAREWENSYAKGFTEGLAAQYEKQFKQESLALVLVQPVQVKTYMEGLSTKKMAVRKTYENERATRKGFDAGFHFNPQKQIAEGAI